MAVRAVKQRKPLRKRPYRRVLSGSLLLVLIVVGGELAAVCSWWVLTGSLFTWERADQARQESVVASSAAGFSVVADEIAQGAAERGKALHPYLGVVQDPALRRGGAPEFDHVHSAVTMPRRRADRYLVGLVGGSMAREVGRQADRALASELEKSCALQGRRVEVIQLAVDDYKQPQQLAAVQQLLMLGGELDCVINLDGFHEVARGDENLLLGLPVWYPEGWARLVGGLPDEAGRLAWLSLVRLGEQRRANAESAADWRLSAALQLCWLVRDRSLARELDAAALAATLAAEHAASSSRARPDRARLSVPGARVEIARIWRRCSTLLQQLCESNGIDYFHFLQPSQYLPDSKPMGSDEQAVALDARRPWAAAVEHGYPLLLAEAAELRRAGVRFEDLTGILRGQGQPLYVDTYCGLCRQGHELLAAHMGAVIRRSFDLEDVAFDSLQVEPGRIEIDNPMQGASLRVLGVDEDGQEHEITAGAFGTTFLPSVDRRVMVFPGGNVWAVQRGHSKVEVRNGDHVVQVPVHADWSDAHEAADGRAAAGGMVPRLRRLGLPEMGGTEQRVRCDDLPSGGLRLLLLSAQPIPAALPQHEFEKRRISVKSLSEGGTSVAATVSLPTAEELFDRPLFARVLVLASDHRTVLAASNTLVLTRG